MNVPEKIGNQISKAYTQNLRAAASDLARTSVPNAREQPPKPDEVVLSERAQLLRKVKEALAATPDVREQKVAELRAQLEAGTYRVPGDKLIEKLLSKLEG